MDYGGKSPDIAADAFIAPNAAVIGDVVIGAQSSIWFACTVRGDGNFIRIGARTNIQDGTVIHVDSASLPTIIGDDVTVGHMALIHACTLEDGSFVGMAATVMDGAVVETGAMVAAGALVTPGKTVKAGQLWAGTPARFMRDCAEREIEMIESVPPEYWAMAQEYLKIGIGVVEKK
ncbi:MAG: gamma carbonic anhydrase family protein [Proteobacteria bacterium]|nr:gamma carbonic anhydrase family protein [Pseudomonadota bacterium]